MGAYQVKEITSGETHRLRHLVLWPHIEREEHCVIDSDNHPDCFHLGVFDGGQIVSVGSFFPQPTPKMEALNPYRLRAMATHPDYRGRNAGRELIMAALEILRKHKADILWCDARLHAVPFYLKLGFTALDEIYEVRNIGPHKFMWTYL